MLEVSAGALAAEARSPIAGPAGLLSSDVRRARPGNGDAQSGGCLDHLAPISCHRCPAASLASTTRRYFRDLRSGEARVIRQMEYAIAPSKIRQGVSVLSDRIEATPTLSTADIDIIEASFRCLTDASAFDDMVRAWDRRLSDDDADFVRPAWDAALSQRLSVVSDLMGKFELESTTQDRIQQPVLEVDAAAFVMSASGGVVAANQKAGQWFGVIPGAQFADDRMEPQARAELDAVRRSCGKGGNRQHTVFRIEAPDGESALAEAFVVDLPDQAEGLVAVRLLELPWTEAVSRQLAEVFGLTVAETEICRLLLSCRDTARVAALRGASVLTVRTQLRSIFAKTETATQADLVRLLALLCARAQRPQRAEVSRWQDPLQRERQFVDADGRRIAYSWMGDEGGVPAILVHTSAMGFLLPPEAQTILADRGIRLYSICRPGFGNSDPTPELDPAEGGALAIAALQAHLGIAQCLGVGVGAGIIPLVRSASRRGQAMPRLLGVGACMPLDDLDYLPVFQRTLFRLVRHAPWAGKLSARASYHVIKRRGAEWYLRRVYADSPVDLAVLGQPHILPFLRSMAEMQFAQGMEAAENEVKLLLTDWHGDLRDDGPHITMLHGAEDKFYPIDRLHAFAARHPNLDLESIPDAGDLLAYQHPELVAHRIADLAIEAAGNG